MIDSIKRERIMLYYPYLGRDILSGFDAYKYSCKDTSPLSNYVMHPFWNQVVKICPLWIAPNLLTFVGFLCCIAHNVLTWIYDYNYEASTLDSAQPIPSGVWIAVSLLLFLSHTLDGIDGKQARRTGTSSPLGELFDHGCDSWSTVFITGTFYSVFGRNMDGYSISEFRMYCIVWTVFFSFHSSHWEKYNTGIMYLPWSYDIAMVGGTVLYAITGVFGYQTFKVLLPGGRPVGVVVEAVLYFFCYGFALSVALRNIYVSYRDGTGKMRPFGEAAAVGDGANDLPMLSLAGLGIAFHAKPKVKESAESSISSLGLDGVLYLLGYHDRHIDLM